MSSNTKCNRCVLDDIISRNKGKKVTLKKDKYGFFEVLVDGKPYGVWFMEVSDECCC